MRTLQKPVLIFKHLDVLRPAKLDLHVRDGSVLQKAHAHQMGVSGAYGIRNNVLHCMVSCNDIYVTFYVLMFMSII
jgi:hypothetical protein